MLFHPLCAGCLPLLLPAGAACVLFQLLVLRGNGREHFHLDATYPRILPPALVRLGPGRGRIFGLLRRSLASSAQRQGSSSAQHRSSFLKCGATLLFSGFLLVRSPPWIRRIPASRLLPGAVVGVDGLYSVQPPVGGNVWQRRPCSRPYPANAAGHREGDGVV